MVRKKKEKREETQLILPELPEDIQILFVKTQRSISLSSEALSHTLLGEKLDELKVRFRELLGQLNDCRQDSSAYQAGYADGTRDVQQKTAEAAVKMLKPPEPYRIIINYNGDSQQVSVCYKGIESARRLARTFLVPSAQVEIWRGKEFVEVVR